MRKLSIRVAILICTLNSLLSSKAHSEIIIDNFNQGAIDVLGTDDLVDDSVSGLDTSQTLGGSRSVAIPAGTSLTVLDGGVPGLEVTVPAQDLGFFTFSYGGGFSGPAFDVDFNANYQIGFEIVFDRAPVGGTLSLVVNATNGQFFSPDISLAGAGSYQILYSDIIDEFGPDVVDLDLATGISFGVFDLPVSGTDTVVSVTSVQTFAAVPEPSSLALLGLAGIAIAIRRSPRH